MKFEMTFKSHLTRINDSLANRDANKPTNGLITFKRI